ncbi:hypothetical protein SynBIOSU31_03005 [Synechococcus sp. BIOS-U3-1]|nr:hypothetical protein SynBIOSU31_03005 [Synechococcus sp. BIOS-U3-1]
MPAVEMTCLQSLADLEQLEGPLMDCFGTRDPETTAAAVRLVLTHMAWNSKRLLGAMVLDRMDADLLSTRADFPDLCQRLVNGADFVNEGNY